jgi:2-keto-4-pentenoate hydratase
MRADQPHRPPRIAEVGTGRAPGTFPTARSAAPASCLESTARRGIRLEPGQWISSGAVTGVHRAHPGQIVEARFRQGLTLACRLVAAEPE